MNGKRLQVLFISSWYPNKVRPLLGIFVKHHAVAIAKLCNVSSIYVFAANEEFIEESEEDNIYTIRAGYKRVSNNIPLYSQFLKYRRYVNAYKKALTVYMEKKGIPDIVNLNVIFPAAIIATYIKQRWNVPYVITEHWTGYFPEDGRYNDWRVRLLAKRSVKNASAVITVSHDLKNKMLELGLKNDYHVISNIVDTQMFTVASDKAKTDNINFIHVSSLDDAQKNVSGIIRAFCKLHNSFPFAILTIIGNGPDKSKLEALSRSLGLGEVIHFMGERTQGELVKLIQQSDAFVLFSNYETQAVVLLEALCCGIPVITTKAGGIGEYVNDKNGILIDANNEQQLVEAMTTIANNRNKFGEPLKIRESVVDKVNSETIAKQFVDVYNKVLNRS